MSDITTNPDNTVQLAAQKIEILDASLARLTDLVLEIQGRCFDGDISELAEIDPQIEEIKQKIDSKTDVTFEDYKIYVSLLDQKIVLLRSNQTSNVGNSVSPSVDISQILLRLETLERNQQKIIDQELATREIYITISEKITDFAIAGDHSQDLTAIKEQIAVLSQGINTATRELTSLKDTLKVSSNFQELYDNLQILIEKINTPVEQLPEKEEPQSTIEKIALSLELFGNISYDNGVIELIGRGRVWVSGFRNLTDGIQSPGEYIEYRCRNRGIIGLTRFPAREKAWDGTDYAFFHTGREETFIFIEDKYYDQNNPLPVVENQLMRIAVDDESYLVWQKIDDDGNAIALHRSDNPITNKYFLFGVPDVDSQISDLAIGKTIVADSNS